MEGLKKAMLDIIDAQRTLNLLTALNAIGKEKDTKEVFGQVFMNEVSLRAVRDNLMKRKEEGEDEQGA